MYNSGVNQCLLCSYRKEVLALEEEVRERIRLGPVHDGIRQGRCWQGEKKIELRPVALPILAEAVTDKQHGHQHAYSVSQKA